MNDGTELYDFAAGRLIALEAGARISDLCGNGNVKDDFDHFLMSNGTSIHEFLVENVTCPLSSR